MEPEYTPNGWTPEDDDQSDDVFPATEAKGELIPPPRKPPTAVSADAAGPEPRPPRPMRRWDRPARQRVPGAIVEAVDAVLDVLDAVADAVRTTADRLVR